VISELVDRFKEVPPGSWREGFGIDPPPAITEKLLGLLVLFEAKMAKAEARTAGEKLEIVKQFVFATRKFGEQKKAIHVLDCVRALKPHYAEIELLYDILCEAVHPNWLGVSQFREFQTDNLKSEEIDELIYATVYQSLLLAHKTAEKLDLSPRVSSSS
jgi:hypothetical protein